MSAVPVPVEAPEVEVRVLKVGSYLLAAAVAFFFVAFLFAFLYLRALDNNGLWGGGKRGHHVHPALTAGILILACVLASVALAHLGKRAERWRVSAGSGALGVGLVAVAVQCWQYTALGFGPGDGGYASVYLGWTGFFTLFALAALLWLEAILASAMRSDVGGLRLAADVESFTLVWTMLGLVEIAAFILLFIVQ